MTSAGPGHDRWQDAVAPYLLRALPEAEQREFEQHLADCPRCRDELDDLRQATDALALAVPAMAPPPELRARVMAVVEQEARLLSAARPDAAPDAEPARPARRPRAARPGLPRRASWLRPAFALPAALAVLALGALIGLAAGGALRDGGVQSVRAQVDPQLAPDARVTLEVADGRATLVADRLPAPPPGRVYQVWVKRPSRDPEPTPTLFTPRGDGSAAAAVPGSLEGIEAVLVSHEPPGGSPRPTSAPVVTVRPPA